MRVAVTVEQCWHRVPGGTAVAAIELLGALARSAEPPDLVGVAAHHREPPPAPWLPPIPVRQMPLPRLALYECWSRWGRPHVERATGRVDVVHATTIVPAAGRAPLVVTIHDLAFRHDPSMFTAHGRRLFERSLDAIRRRAALVLCSSTATMDDCAAAGIDADRLRLVLLGVRPVAAVGPEAVGSVLRARDLRRPYLLFVGTLEPRKNLARLLDAFAELAGAVEHDLVVVGPDGWGERATAPERVAGRVHLTGFVTEPELDALLAGAAALCYPSLREGFGLPVLQAMAHGTPVVTSRGTSTEEVAGGAAVLVEPTDTADIARGILDALARHDELAAAGRARAASLTWDATASRTMDAYREVAA